MPAPGVPEVTSQAGRALVSVHDVMPSTLNAVRQTVEVLEAMDVRPVTLLVVPGLDWSDTDRRTLIHLQDRGYRLAGHGWRHCAETIRGLRHRLHAALISRNVAEHLALGGTEIGALLRRCFRRFNELGLNPPRLYVPPAWAMGALERDAMGALPFRYYEDLGGYHDARSGRYWRVPLVGYEADRPARVHALRIWNGINVRRAVRCGWLRIAIHPCDLSLGLAGDLRCMLRRGWHFADLDTWAGSSMRP